MATASEGPLSVERAPADMRPCRRCGRTDPRRMFALMTLWFGPPAGFRAESGYFYLCPVCYQACIAPLTDVILHRLMEHHPVARKGLVRPASQAVPAEPPPGDEPSPG